MTMPFKYLKNLLYIVQVPEHIDTGDDAEQVLATRSQAAAVASR